MTYKEIKSSDKNYHSKILLQFKNIETLDKKQNFIFDDDYVSVKCDKILKMPEYILLSRYASWYDKI